MFSLVSYVAKERWNKMEKKWVVDGAIAETDVVRLVVRARFYTMFAFDIPWHSMLIKTGHLNAYYLWFIGSHSCYSLQSGEENDVQEI